MKTIAASTFILLATAPAFGAGNASMSGKWKVHTSIAGNESDQTCIFMQTDKDLTGTCSSDEKTVKVTGSVENNKATWKYDSEYNGTSLTLTYTATLDAAGKITGTVEVQPFGVTGDYTATPENAVDPVQK
jgi:hypothetical protein